MQTAYLIMAHKGPEQLIRLIDKLGFPGTDFFIHVDAKADISDFIGLTGIARVHLIRNRKTCNWGGYSFVEAIFSALRELSQSAERYEFIHLLSAQDYPVVAPAVINRFLSQNKGKNFISFESSSNSSWWMEARNRYEQYHFTDYNFQGKYLIQRILNAIIPKRKFPGGMVPYGGSDSSWWTISGECADFITQRFYADARLRKFLKLCWGADEFTIATLIMNSPFKHTVINNNLRYIDWSEGNAHPKLLGVKDIGSILRSGKFFARKFDANNGQAVLDALDSYAATGKAY